jgi:cytochrome c551/c552
MSEIRTLCFALLATALASTPLAAQDGKTLFTIHCSACHMPDRQLVGPSLVEVTKLYANKQAEFLAWCVEPKQKRQGVIQMPAMGHVGEANLKLIHAHILEASKGLQEVKIKGVDPFYASTSMRKRPQVQRLFMPEAGPAAIAVAVNDELHYCWDAGECRLRYIWKGDFIDGWAVWKGNGNALAKIQGEVLFREESNPVTPTGSSPHRTPKFLGYSLKEGLPTFRWSLQGREISETIRPTADGNGLVRSFEIKGTTSPIQLRFKPSEKMSVSKTSLRTDKDGRGSVTLTPKP